MRIAGLCLALGLMLALGVPAVAQPPVPRPATEFTLVDPSGQQSALSGYKGKVILIQFLYTTCEHCQRLAKILTAMQREFAPKVQILGVAFDDKVTPEMAAAFRQKFNVGYPVVYAPRDTVLSYLGIGPKERLGVPQILIIDKTWTVRAQTPPLSSSDYQREDVLRNALKELAAQPDPAPPPAPAKNAGKKSK